MFSSDDSSSRHALKVALYPLNLQLSREYHAGLSRATNFFQERAFQFDDSILSGSYGPIVISLTHSVQRTLML